MCRVAAGDMAAVIGENRKLLVFPLSEVPELARGRGVILQRYKDARLSDACAFDRKDGLRDANGRVFTAAELKEYIGERSHVGRIVPRGFAKSNKFG